MPPTKSRESVRAANGVEWATNCTEMVFYLSLPGPRSRWISPVRCGLFRVWTIEWRDAC